ncbi:MAG: RAMP superfamily CRISPR-associated protein [Candidatus Scalinduaceae bacterium]
MLKEKTFEITITAKEPLRIGGKEDPLSGADNPVTHVGGKLVIPGSSLKGALRTEIERFFIDSYYSNGKWKEGFEYFKPCIPSDKLSADEERLVEAGKYRDQGGNCRYPCNDKKCGNNKSHSICPVCYLLGSMGLNGFVKVPFLYAETSINELYSSRIDRATKTISRGSNRPYELVPDGSVFNGTLTVLLEDTILNWKLGESRNLGEARTLGDKWLEDNKGKVNNKKQEEFISMYILERLKSINVLGGYKSKGFGLVQISAS